MDRRAKEERFYGLEMKEQLEDGLDFLRIHAEKEWDRFFHQQVNWQLQQWKKLATSMNRAFVAALISGFVMQYKKKFFEYLMAFKELEMVLNNELSSNSAQASGKFV